MDPYHDIYDSQPKDGSLEKGIRYDRKNLGVQVCQVIRIPETQPGKPDKEDTGFY